MADPVGCLFPSTLLAPSTTLVPDGLECRVTVTYGPGGGGHGAVMSNAFFERYEVAGKWRGVKRVKISTRGQ